MNTNRNVGVAHQGRPDSAIPGPAGMKELSETELGFVAGGKCTVQASCNTSGQCEVKLVCELPF